MALLLPGRLYHKTQKRSLKLLLVHVLPSENKLRGYGFSLMKSNPQSAKIDSRNAASATLMTR